MDCSRKDQVKKKSKKKMVLKKKRKKWSRTKKRRKEVEVEVEVQFELYCVKLVELMIFEKKNYAPLVFRNYFVPYISFLHS